MTASLAVAPPRCSEWLPGRPVDLRATLGPLRRGSGDPTMRFAGAGSGVGSGDGSLWRTSRTPLGPATLNLGVRRADGVVVATAWGEGAQWALDTLPDLLGASDDTQGWDPSRHPLLRDLACRNPGWRVPRSQRVVESLVPAVLEQLVTGTEARRGFSALVRRFGMVAPGPVPAGMMLPPTPQQWALIPSWEWHQAGVGATRSRTVLRAMTVADRLEESVTLSAPEAERRLRAVPGIGVWTAAEIRQRAHGDADAVSVGDFHLCSSVGVALTGSPVDDDGMRELMAPFAGHRYRVQRLVELSGIHQERRGPRFAPRDMRAF